MRLRAHLCRRLSLLALLCATALAAPSRVFAFDIQFTIADPSGFFNTTHRQILNTALAITEATWESKITGHQPGISIPTLPISVQPMFSGLAQANYSSTTSQGGFILPTAGFMQVNVNEIVNFSNWNNTGVNVIDELLTHETGHVLGIGTLWTSNNVYVNNTFQYTGANGLAAFRAEFNRPSATFVPVENAGAAGTINQHWDQLMRSSTQEGNPANPFSLDPRLGIVDSLGRDLSLEMMTGAIDPDYGEPWLSNLTVQSLQDLGYTVVPVPEPTTPALALSLAAALLRRRRYPA